MKIQFWLFLLLCEQLIFAKKVRPISKYFKTAYLRFFRFPVSNQDKKWVPHVTYESCRLNLIWWASEEKKYFKFESLMLWREPSKHENYGVFFCLMKTAGFNIQIYWLNILNSIYWHSISLKSDITFGNSPTVCMSRYVECEVSRIVTICLWRMKVMTSK